MIGLKELRTLLKEPPAEDDAYIKALERAAVAHAERVTGKYLGATATHTDYLVGKGGQVLYLSGPIASGDGLAVTEAPYPGATGEDITEDVVVRGLKLFRTDGTQFAPGYEYAVTYSRGYAADADLRGVVREIRGAEYTDGFRPYVNDQGAPGGNFRDADLAYWLTTYGWRESSWAAEPANPMA